MQSRKTDIEHWGAKYTNCTRTEEPVVTNITTMKAFNEALESLPLEQQRLVAAEFVADVLDITDDTRVKGAQQVAADPEASPEALMSAYHSAWHASVESAIHSGFELIDWHKQAAHFVAKACAESLTPAHPGITWRHLAHNVANHCRMGRLCASMDHEQAEPDLSVSEDALKKQIHTQFQILSDFLQKQ